MAWRWAVALWLALAPLAAAAQAPDANPSLSANVRGIRDAKTTRSLALRRFDVAVTLRGAIAETVVTAAFENRSEDSLEGDFRLTLPAGAIVTGYALDVGDAMIDGVLVDQARAKAVYEATVRRGVDPGLAEVTADNQFRTRVFPILPGKGRTIRVRFTAPAGIGYLLPLKLDAPREGWSIAVRASGTAEAPRVFWPGRDGEGMARAGEGYAADGKGKDALVGALEIRRPVLPVAIASRNALGERYLQLSGEIGPVPASARAGRVRVYWDRSRSRLGDHGEELALLRRTLAALAPQAIEVVTFASGGAERAVVADAAAAVALLAKVRYRGTTSYAAIAGDAAPAERCLLFSDGRPGVERSAVIGVNCRLDAVTASPRADMAWLRHLAAVHGGRAVRLGKDSGAAEKAIVTSAPSVTAVLDDSGQRLAFVQVEAGTGRWLVLARAPGRGGVRVQIGGVVRRELPAAAADFDGEGALLASEVLATLGATESRDAYVALSRRYGIASPSLSFLVLETPEDYVEANVAPPAGYPAEQLAEYRALREDADADAAETRAEQLEKMVGLWSEQVEWWETRFDPRARPNRESKEEAPPMPSVAPAPEPMPAPVQQQPAAPGTVVDAVTADDVGALPDANVAEAIQRVPGLDTDGFAGGDDDNIVVSGIRAEPPKASIAIEAWQPDRAYIKAFDAAPARFEALFAEQEAKGGGVPAFYLDTAEWLHRRGRTPDAVEMVLSALDVPTANDATVAIVADRLERYGAIDRAVELRERHAVLDSARPQPKRALALALARRAALEPSGARADLERAVALLGEVALTPNEGRWEGIELIALIEANALIPKLRALGGAAGLDARLVKLLDVDIRVVVEWNTDATDLDLWIDEPNGERAIYNHPRTAIGGRLSNDMTAGYGPEEYLLRRAPAGAYTVRADVYASDALDPNGASVISARLIHDFGRANQREERVDIELPPRKPDEARDEGDKLIGRIVIEPGKRRQ